MLQAHSLLRNTENGPKQTSSYREFSKHKNQIFLIGAYCNSLL